ncbi:MAG: C40 family peptidase [Campylobacterota bacterium]|nr:C40 family peptidase [Campylobacterota bacterium]
MNNKILITVSDLSGIKQYTLPGNIKKIIIIFLFLLLVVFAGLFYYLNEFTNKVNDLETNNKTLLIQNNAFNQKKSALKEEIESISNSEKKLQLKIYSLLKENSALKKEKNIKNNKIIKEKEKQNLTEKKRKEKKLKKEKEKEAKKLQEKKRKAEKLKKEKAKKKKLTEKKRKEEKLKKEKEKEKEAKKLQEKKRKAENLKKEKAKKKKLAEKKRKEEKLKKEKEKEAKVKKRKAEKLKKEKSKKQVNNSKKEVSLVGIAKTKLGKRYVWGAIGPKTFDCSGFTSFVYKKTGINLPRTSRQQSKYGKYVKRKNLQVGDLIFFDTSRRRKGIVNHVGIYMGNNKFIHASSAKKRVIISSLNKNFYGNRYKWARRIKN